MPPLTLSTGEGVLLWLRDRSSLSPGMPVSDLRQAFQSIGIGCEVRYTDELSFWELAITTRECLQLPLLPAQFIIDPDGFLLTKTSSGLRLTGSLARGLAFAIWELLERMGWEWPTPQIWREPKVQTWVFEEGTEIHRPALPHRILFAEQVEITPDIIRWLSRLRFNTLFPSNPSRFSEPEEQFPDQSLAVAQDLGLDLIAGGDCLAWLLAPLGMEAPSGWEGLSESQIKNLEKSTLDLWQEMGEPRPRLSVWPGEEGRKKGERFLRSLLKHDQQIRLETELGVLTDPDDRVLLHHCVRGFPGRGADGEILDSLPAAGNKGNRSNLYLFLDSCGWDAPTGNLLSPLLWSLSGKWIETAALLGWGGACLSLVGLPAYSYFERAGFSLAACARVMWTGSVSVSREYSQALIQSQFEAGASVVSGILTDAEEIAQQAEALGSLPPGGILERVHDFLVTDEVRDRFDQRAAELEESPPSEPCLELARSLATLTALHELEECSDVHEERALARTIWAQNGIDRWPRWLQDASPLAERLRNLMK